MPLIQNFFYVLCLTIFVDSAERKLLGLPTLPTLPTLPSLPSLKKTTAIPFNLIPHKDDDTTGGFAKYKCQICKDIMFENVDFLQNQLRVSETAILKLCDAILQKFFNQGRLVVCHYYLKSHLDKYLRDHGSAAVELATSENVCKIWKLCK